jgi:hypothetical protein
MYKTWRMLENNYTMQLENTRLLLGLKSTLLISRIDIFRMVGLQTEQIPTAIEAHAFLKFVHPAM